MDLWFSLFVTFAAVVGAIGFSLVLVGYLTTVMSCFAFGTRWAFTVLLLPVVGSIWFAYHHRETHLKIFRQLVAGVICMAVALGLLYGGPGSVFAARAVDQLKAEQAAQDGPAAVPEAPAAKP